MKGEGKPYQTHGIPVRLHGDGTPVTGIQRAWVKSVESWSLSSVLCTGTSRFTNFILYMVHAAMILSGERNARDAFFRKLNWSLEWAYKGRHPDRDDTGRLYTTRDPEYKCRLEPLADVFFDSLARIV